MCSTDGAMRRERLKAYSIGKRKGNESKDARLVEKVWAGKAKNNKKEESNAI